MDRVGDVAPARGEWVEADALYGESLPIRRELLAQLGTPEAQRGVGASLWQLAALARECGMAARSCELLQEAVPLFVALAASLKTPQSLADLEAIRQQLAQDSYPAGRPDWVRCT